MRRSVFLSIIIIGILLWGRAFFSHPTPVSADSGINQVYLPFLVNGGSSNSNSQPQNTFPSLTQFVDTVKNGEAKIVGVYVQNILAKRVIQQPQGNYEYISEDPDLITQFSLTTPEVIGLLAHNHLAGRLFFDIKLGERIFVVKGDGQFNEFRVVEIQSYQVIKEDKVTKYRNIETNEVLDTAQLFSKFYMGEVHVTLQTCITQDGNPTWGRMFIKAVPLQ